MLAADTAYLDGTQAFCTLLARKSWSNQGGVFAFGDAGDRAAYVAIEKRRMDAANKIQILQRDGRDQLIKGRDAVRDILDRAGRS
jgi:hypothetical protein